MALTANVYLEINAVTKKGRIVDASNYVAEGISLSALSAKGLGVVTGPTGVAIYTGTTVGSPLVNLMSTTNSVWFNLPLDSNSEILNGTYSFTYSLRYAITAGIVNSVTAPSTLELEFTWAGRVLTAGDSVVTVANTETENNGTFTVATAAFDEGIDNSTIVVTQTTLVNEALATGTYSFDVTRAAFAGSTYTWNGCNFVTPAVTTTYDCESTQFGQIIFADSSVIPAGQIIVSRSLSGYYPNGLSPEPATNPVTTTSPSLTFNELAVGTWTHALVLNMSVTQDDGLVYTYTVRDTGETAVTCVGTLCGLTPCIESLKDKYYASFQRGQVSGLEATILMILQLYALAKEYKTCGNNAMYAATVAQLESVLDESGECSCGCCDENQDVPYWVNNLGLSSQTILEDLYDQVQALVTSVSYGDTTIFQAPQFYGYDDSFSNPTASFTNIEAITIPASYLDYPTVDGAFGSKFIVIDLKAETLSTGGQARVTLVSGDVGLYSRDFGVTDEGVELTTKLVIRTQKVGEDMLVWVLQNTTFNNKVQESMESESLNPIFTNILASGDDLVLNFTPVLPGAAIKTSYTHLKITACKSLI
jgi:hypothetical protein